MRNRSRLRLPLLLCAVIGAGHASTVAAQILYSVSSGPGFPLVSIDPTTGAVQTLQPTGSFSGINSISAFDPLRRRLFFLADAAGVQTLVVVNVQTGAVATHAIPLTGASYAFLQYDPTTRTLYSVASSPGFPVVTIDPDTGVVTTLQPTGSFNGVSNNISAFDAAGRRLFFVVDAAGVPTLVVVNVQTGAVATQPIPVSGGSYVFLQYDPATGVLYSVASSRSTRTRAPSRRFNRPAPSAGCSAARPSIRPEDGSSFSPMPPESRRSLSSTS
ncbi:MAG: hypothetical protein DMF54_08905 [Acidobacteria bacterium]|nr:MAG: hypothetical protein DMF54_08905 [Acidobacteriota bacterium]